MFENGESPDSATLDYFPAGYVPEARLVMTAAAFLNVNPRATEAQIRDALTGLKCRCGTHVSILRAIKRAQATMSSRLP